MTYTRCAVHVANRWTTQTSASCLACTEATQSYGSCSTSEANRMQEQMSACFGWWQTTGRSTENWSDVWGVHWPGISITYQLDRCMCQQYPLYVDINSDIMITTHVTATCFAVLRHISSVRRSLARICSFTCHQQSWYILHKSRRLNHESRVCQQCQQYLYIYESISMVGIWLDNWG